jgi:hypothetical protein
MEEADHGLFESAVATAFCRRSPNGLTGDPVATLGRAVLNRFGSEKPPALAEFVDVKNSASETTPPSNHPSKRNQMNLVRGRRQLRTEYCLD